DRGAGGAHLGGSAPLLVQGRPAPAPLKVRAARDPARRGRRPRGEGFIPGGCLVLRSIGFAFALCLLAAACSKEPASTGSAGRGSGGGAHKTVDVAMTADMTFVPDTVTIDVGDTVRWTNKDATTKHTATRKASPESFDSGKIGANATYSHTFKTKGTFPYICVPHAPDMKGTVVVR